MHIASSVVEYLQYLTDHFIFYMTTCTIVTLLNTKLDLRLFTHSIYLQLLQQLVPLLYQTLPQLGDLPPLNMGHSWSSQRFVVDNGIFDLSFLILSYQTFLVILVIEVYNNNLFSVSQDPIFVLS